MLVRALTVPTLSCLASVFYCLAVQHGRNFGLVLIVSLGCTPEVETGVPYEGSCPILIECADVLASQELSTQYRMAYAADGNCWSHGSNYWQQCRDSCVDALVSINLAAQSVGGSCGSCETDSDCSSFGVDARCEGSWCARPQLGADDGSVADDTETETGADDDGSPGEAVDEIDPECQVDAPVVVIDTNLGVMTFELDRVGATTVANSFLRHLSADFYDDTIVHRVVDGLVLQSGVYAQGPALRSGSVATKISTLPALSHGDAAIALVVYDDQTVAAQWYVTDGAQAQLDGAGAVFGHLTDGLEVRDQISEAEVSTLPWMGYVLLDYPNAEIVVNDVYCVE
jgi:cyclophilin family peptidyl-prolyl cis-trans isomerase